MLPDLRPIGTESSGAEGQVFRGWSEGVFISAERVKYYYFDAEHGGNGFGYYLQEPKLPVNVLDESGPLHVDGHLFVATVEADGSPTIYHLYTPPQDDPDRRWYAESDRNPGVIHTVDTTSRPSVTVGRALALPVVSTTSESLTLTGNIVGIAAVTGDPRGLIQPNGAVGRRENKRMDGLVGRFFR